MANSVSHARLPYPILNARYTLEYVGLDADGDPTDPTTPDTEVSQDGGAFADAAEEVTTITGSNGCGYITLTGAEMNNSLVLACVKVASGPKATVFSLRPRNLAVVGSGTLSAGSAGGGTLGTLLAYDVTGCFIRTTGGTGGGGTGGASNQARRIITYNTSTGAFTVSPNWETTPSTDTTYDVLLPEGVTLGMLKALNPTTAGRTLDVASTGEAGLDFNNILSTSLVTLHSLTVTGATTLTGNVSLGGTLSVSGTTSLGAVTITATGSSSGLTITGGPTCVATQGALQLVGGSTSGAGMSMTTTDGHGLVITATGAARNGMFVTGGSSGVSNGAYFVAGGTGFGVRATSLDLVSNLSVGGTTTLTGAVTASNASNNITGITVAALANDSITSSAIASSAGTELAGAVWDLATSGHTTSGTFGAAVVAAGSAGDPWSTSLPGAYGAGTAGYIVGTNINATVSSRASQTSLDTLDDYVDTEVAAIKAKTDNLPTDPADASDIAASFSSISSAISALNNLSAAQVNAEVVDALSTDTYAEPGQGAPSATTSLAAKLNYLYKWARNKVTQTSSQTSFYADDGTTVDQKATTSDNGTTFTRGEIASGP